MARSGASAVWTVVGIVAAILLGLAVLFGPRLYREGRQLVGPISDLARADEEMAAIDRELPFTPPADGVVSEARLEVFFQIRRELIPHYQRWREMREELERAGDRQSWRATKETLTAVRDVLSMQTTLLRQHGMSGTEFRWLERQVYDDWYDRLGVNEPDLRLRDATEEDQRYVAGLVAQYGQSPALSEMQRHLETRLEKLSLAPDGEASVNPNRDLFERHRDQIAALDLSQYQELHTRLRQAPGEDLSVPIGSDSGRRSLVIEGHEPEATPGP